ncbi:MAG: outer membrane protein assembly factor BamA, partial [Zetaproteobacteria bacterium]
MMHVAWLLLLTSVLLGGSGDARAEAWQELRISDIAISGNRYIEKETILDRIHLRKGMFFDRKAVSQDVKRIYRTGFFSDVRVEGHRRGNGVALEYRVKEYPLIAKVEISGNDEVTTKDLKLRLKLKPGQIFNPRNRQADINTIRKGYIKKGYYQVAVDISAKPAENGRVNVHIKIDEGVKTHIRRIRFIGNRAVDDATLRGRIASSEQSLATWITDRDIFDRKRVAADVQMIEQYYQNQGFLDARVESTSTRLSSDRQGFDISYSIHEGPRYTLGEIRLQGDLVPDRATLEREITLKQGDVYSLKALRETIMKLTETVGDEGYAYATVTPLFKRDLANRIVDITLDIDKGREVYVERIDIAGNASTNDYVIRRELRQDEGARYSATAVRRSKERLKRLPYIEDVRVAMPKGSSPHKAKMRVDVTEKKSGSV